jgi:hypothetical protein
VFSPICFTKKVMQSVLCYMVVKVKVKISLEQATKVERGSIGCCVVDTH